MGDTHIAEIAVAKVQKLNLQIDEDSAYCPSLASLD